MLRPFGDLCFYKVVQAGPSPVAPRQGFSNGCSSKVTISMGCDSELGSLGSQTDISVSAEIGFLSAQTPLALELRQVWISKCILKILSLNIPGAGERTQT